MERSPELQIDYIMNLSEDYRLFYAVTLAELDFFSMDCDVLCWKREKNIKLRLIPKYMNGAGICDFHCAE